MSYPAPSLVAAGAVPVLFLQKITALAGSTADCLAAVGTAALQTPYPVSLYLNGLKVRYTLRNGSDATTGDGSVLQPNDFNSVSNAKVWYQDLA